MDECIVHWCHNNATRLKNTLCFKHYQRKLLTGTFEPSKHFIDTDTIDGDRAFCEKCKGYVRVTFPPGRTRPVCTVSKRESAYKSVYGITDSQVLELKNRQKNLCAICGKESKLYVDHNHLTNEVRGLLCSKCNLGLGHFDDSGAIMKKALEYISAGGVK